MKILIINFEYPPLGGGGGVATQLLARELSHHHTVHVLTTRFGKLPRREQDGTVVVHRVNVLGRRGLYAASLRSLATFVPQALRAGWSIGRREHFDVLNAQFVLPSGIVGAALSSVLGVPFVLSFIGGDLYDPSKGVSPHRHAVLRWLVRRVAARAAACTAISEDTKRRAQELHGVSCAITVVPLGIARVSIETHARRSRRVPERIRVFVTMGRLIPRKGHELLLRAWQEVRDAHLIIVGDGPLKDRLRHLASELGIAQRVSVRGYVSEEEKQQLLRMADGYVSAALHEGFGLVFLEAMQAGLPIVAANVGGQQDFLTDGENALLVPPGRAQPLAAAVRRLIDNPSLAQRLASNNERRAAQFSAAASAAAFERILRQAVTYADRH